ncbi:MAG: DUF192 domain-containing protein [Acidimicrobiales bacterium]
MAWLVRDDKVLASLDVASTRAQRRRGLLGRDSFDGALLIRPARSVHTFGMRFTIDVAVIDPEGVVLATLCMKPRRVSRPRRGGVAVIEAQHGSFERWGLKVGDRLEIRS